MCVAQVLRPVVCAFLCLVNDLMVRHTSERDTHHLYSLSFVLVFLFLSVYSL
jgi:hypothetical protein